MQSQVNPKRARISKAVREAVLIQFNDQGRICDLCQRVVEPSEPIHLDHIIPLIRGGTDDLSNLRYIHASCNTSKGKYLDEEYIEVMEERIGANLDGYEGLPDYRPDEFTEPIHSGVEGHEMELRRRYHELLGLKFHVSCSCSAQSELHDLEVDAGAWSSLHESKIHQQIDKHTSLRFRDHINKRSEFSAPGSLNINESRWIGLCACGWSTIERSKEKRDDLFEEHWKSLLEDPEMYEDYVAFLKEQEASKSSSSFE